MALAIKMAREGLSKILFFLRLTEQVTFILSKEAYLILQSLDFFVIFSSLLILNFTTHRYGSRDVDLKAVKESRKCSHKGLKGREKLFMVLLV